MQYDNESKNDVATGMDDIKTPPIKQISSIISPVLSHIINQIFRTGIFPDKLKTAKVSPI